MRASVCVCTYVRVMFSESRQHSQPFWGVHHTSGAVVEKHGFLPFRFIKDDFLKVLLVARRLRQSSSVALLG